MSAPELFTILINNMDLFMPGDTISGFVFKQRSKILTKNVKITCRGKAVASLDGHSDTVSSNSLRIKGIRYLLPKTSKEEYFLLSFICLDDYIYRSFGSAEEEEDGTRTESSSTCPPLLFQLKLPRLLPPSCHLHYGFISYDILFEWQSLRPGTETEWDHKVKSIPITIGASVNLNEIPFAAEQAESCIQEKFNFLCYNSGSISLTMKINKMGYIPGEELHFKIITNNAAKFDVEKIHVTLRQERTFYVGELKKRFHKTLVSCEGPRVARGENSVWESYLIVPDIPLKFFWPCSLIKIAFFLQVKLMASKYAHGCSTPKNVLENSVSVLIGDIPVDTDLYLERFPLNYGTREILSNCLSDTERFWLGINCLFHGAQQDDPRIMEDFTPSYAVAIATSPQRQLRDEPCDRTDTESPPPTYQEVMQLFN